MSAVNEFPALNNQIDFLEYSTREAYGGNITCANDLSNVTWRHLVTKRK